VTVSGTLYIIAAPSGAGKTSLVKALLEREQGIALSVSYTSRPPRPGEIDGQHYHFVSRDVFEHMATTGAFFEHANVHGDYKGTARTAVEPLLAADRDVLLSFHGVGPKCANLALGIAVGKPFGVPVDIHVHRITNRWGYVATTNPERTMLALEKMLPPCYWIEINERLVPFGKFICTAARPKCSTCLLLSMCRQVGVVNPR
jgi:hypothetical protein